VKTARFTISAQVEPVWWHGVVVEGAHGWNPLVIHPSALNHAIGIALGFGGLRERAIVFNHHGRKINHSKPCQEFWASPGIAVKETLTAVEYTLSSSAGDYGRVSATPSGNSSKILVPNREGDGLEYVGTNARQAVVKPKIITGWLGEWTTRIFTDDPAEIPDSFVATLGPLAATVIIERCSEWETVTACNPGDVDADHLIDPTLIKNGAISVRPISAAPWPLAWAKANAKAGDAFVYCEVNQV
jgi:hypothetical protein